MKNWKALWAILIIVALMIPLNAFGARFEDLSVTKLRVGTVQGLTGDALDFTGTGVITSTNIADTTGNISLPLAGTLVDTNGNAGTISQSTDPTLAVNDGKVKLVWTDAAELTKKQATFHVPDDWASGGVFELLCTRSGTGDPPSVDFEQFVDTPLAASQIVAALETAVELDADYTSSPQQVTLTPTHQTYAAGQRVTFNYWRDNTDASTDSLEVSNAIWTYTRIQ